MNKEYEVTMTREEFDKISEADGRPIMDMRNQLVDTIRADGQDPEMYDPTFYDEDPLRMKAVFNQFRIKSI